MVECEICYEDYQEGDLHLHMEVCVARLIFRCIICEEDYVSKEGLWNHLVIHQVEDEAKEQHCYEMEAKYKLHQCILCNNQRAYCANVFQSHIQTVHDGFFLRCSDCGELFRSEEHKNDHSLRLCKARRHGARSKGNDPEGKESVRIAVESMIQDEVVTSVPKESVMKPACVEVAGKTSVVAAKLTQPRQQESPKPVARQNNHYQLAPDGKSWLCPICDNTFKTKLSLKHHKTVCHTEPKYKCDICSMAFHFMNGLTRHRIGCVGRRCHICNMLFRQRSLLDHHLKYEHRNTNKSHDVQVEKTNDVENGNKTSKGENETEIIEESIEHRPNSESNDVEVETFGDLLSQIQHPHTSNLNQNKEQDKTQVEDGSTERMRRSEQDTNGTKGSSVNSDNGSKPHTQHSNAGKSLICSICDVAFKTRSSLNHHKRVCHTEPTFICPICSTGFHFATALLRHQNGCVGRRCHICGVLFRLRAQLTLHLKYEHLDRTESNAGPIEIEDDLEDEPKIDEDKHEVKHLDRTESNAGPIEIVADLEDEPKIVEDKNEVKRPIHSNNSNHGATEASNDLETGITIPEEDKNKTEGSDDPGNTNKHCHSGETNHLHAEKSADNLENGNAANEGDEKIELKEQRRGFRISSDVEADDSDDFEDEIEHPQSSDSNQVEPEATDTADNVMEVLDIDKDNDVCMEPLGNSAPDSVEPEGSHYLEKEKKHPDGGSSLHCSICNYTFKDRRGLRIHNIFRHTARRYKCSICSIAFLCPQDVRSHRKSCAGLRCRICDIKFLSRSQLRSHKYHKHRSSRNKNGSQAEQSVSVEDGAVGNEVEQKSQVEEEHLDVQADDFDDFENTFKATQTGYRPRECSICKETFKNRFNLRYHMLVRHSEPKYKCSICSKAFYYANNLRDHWQGCSEFQCRICRKKCMSRASLTYHLYHEHQQGSSPNPDDLNKVEENTEPDNAEAQESNEPWKRIERTQPNRLTLECSICNVTFRNRRSWRYHRLVRHTEPMHKCSVCSKTFHRAKAMRRHWSVCSEFRCRICSKKCMTRANLKHHLYHEHQLGSSDDDVNDVEVDGKENTESNGVEAQGSDKLRRNIKRPHESRFLQCSICKATFPERYSYRQHMALQHMEQLYKCPNCSERFHYRHDMYRHLKGCSELLCHICGEKYFSGSQLDKHYQTKHSDSNKSNNVQIEEDGTKASENRNEIVIEEKCTGDRIGGESNEVRAEEFESGEHPHNSKPNHVETEAIDALEKFEAEECDDRENGMELDEDVNEIEIKEVCIGQRISSESNRDATADGPGALENHIEIQQPHISNSNHAESQASDDFEYEITVFEDEDIIKLNDEGPDELPISKPDEIRVKNSGDNRKRKKKIQQRPYGGSQQCKICGAAFKERHHLKYHMVIKHSKPKHKCNTCSRAFHILRELRRHQPGCTKFRCETCGIKFFTGVKLVQHVRERHPEKSDSLETIAPKDEIRGTKIKETDTTTTKRPTGGPPRQCPVCKLMFKDRHRLKYHRIMHHTEPGLKCSICSKAFHYPQALDRHWKHCSELRCYICDIKFSSYAHLKNHKNESHQKTAITIVEDEDVIEVVDECAKKPQSDTSDNAEAEGSDDDDDDDNDDDDENGIERPNGTRIWQCSICNAKLNNRFTLRHHKIVCHTGPRFKCSVCSKAYHYQRDLQRHRKACLKLRCSTCDIKFAKPSQLIHHNSLKHPENSSPNNVETVAHKDPEDKHTASEDDDDSENSNSNSDDETEASDDTDDESVAVQDDDHPGKSSSSNVEKSDESDDPDDEVMIIEDDDVIEIEDECEGTENSRKKRSKRPENRQCVICNVTFKTKQNLRYHTIVRHSVPRFKCSLCPMSFHFPKDHRRHLETCSKVDTTKVIEIDESDDEVEVVEEKNTLGAEDEHKERSSSSANDDSDRSDILESEVTPNNEDSKLDDVEAEDADCLEEDSDFDPLSSNSSDVGDEKSEGEVTVVEFEEVNEAEEECTEDSHGSKPDNAENGNKSIPSISSNFIGNEAPDAEISAMDKNKDLNKVEDTQIQDLDCSKPDNAEEQVDDPEREIESIPSSGSNLTENQAPDAEISVMGNKEISVVEKAVPQELDGSKSDNVEGQVNIDDLKSGIKHVPGSSSNLIENEAPDAEISVMKNKDNIAVENTDIQGLHSNKSDNVEKQFNIDNLESGIKCIPSNSQNLIENESSDSEISVMENEDVIEVEDTEQVDIEDLESGIKAYGIKVLGPRRANVEEFVPECQTTVEPERQETVEPERQQTVEPERQATVEPERQEMVEPERQATVESGKPSWTCPVCGEAFAKKRLMKSHMESLHTNPKYKCKLCSKTYHVKREMFQHLKRCVALRCHKCDTKFKTFDLLYSHMAQICPGREASTQVVSNSEPVDVQTEDVGDREDEIETTEENTVDVEGIKPEYQITMEPYKCQTESPVHHEPVEAESSDDHHENEVKTSEKNVKVQRQNADGKRFACKHCDSTFKSKSGWHQHSVINHTEPKYKCNVCAKKFHFSYHARRHQRTCGERHCQKCNVSFTSRGMLRIHELNEVCFGPSQAHESDQAESDTMEAESFDDHYENQVKASEENLEVQNTDDKHFACSMCDASFKTKGGLYQHSIASHTEPTYKCGVCGKKFHFNYTSRRHQRSCKEQRHKKCKKPFPDRSEPRVLSKKGTQGRYNKSTMIQTKDLGDLEDGIQSTEGNFADVPENHIILELNAAGAVCSDNHRENKVDTSRKNLKVRRQNADGKRFACKHCGATFKSKSGCSHHLIVNHTDPVYACVVCDKKFHFYYHSRNHQRRCVGRRCSECNINFPSRRVLRVHKLNKHPDDLTNANEDDDEETSSEDEKPRHDEGDGRRYICSICGMEFDKRNARAYHMMASHTEPQYKCKFCPKAFFIPSGLIRHEKPCGKRFQDNPPSEPARSVLRT